MPYRLTPRMLQHFRNSLTEYHRLFDGGRCDSWQQEELIVKAIQSDTQSQHQAFWTEGGHDDQADVRVRTNGEEHAIQIKSGRIKKSRGGVEQLVLSGHRLGRFDGVMEDISAYLNGRDAQILSVPYRRVDGEQGRQHKYRVCYIAAEVLAQVDPRAWERRGAAWHQTSPNGVEFSLRPSMSWQIWWMIPLVEVVQEEEWSIG